MTRFFQRDAMVFVLLVGVAVASRLFPHAPNFTALIAVSLLAGWFFKSRLVAAAVPLSAMLISDSVIGGYDPRLMLAVYGAMLLPLALKRFLADGRGLGRVAVASLACSLAFFLVTNAGVWLFSPMYEPSLAGLVTCFAAAVPFLKYQLAGDMSYSLALFAIAAAAPRLALLRLPAPAALAQPA